MPAALNPAYQVACENALRWADRFGLLDGDPAERRRHSQHGLLTGRCYPSTSPRALQIVTDWSAWLFFLDDRCDEGDLKSQPEELRRLHAIYLRILEHGELPDEAEPLERALYDLRERMLELGSREWLLFFAEDVRQYFAAHHWEAMNRAVGLTPSFAAYRSMRPFTSAVYTCFSLFHITDGIEFSAALYQDRTLQGLSALANQIVSHCNDLQSFEKELMHGDVHNAVIVLMEEQGSSRSTAIEIVTDLHNQDMSAFLSLSEEVVEQDLSRYADRAAFIRCLRSWVRGNYDWGNVTYRYREGDVEIRIAKLKSTCPPPPGTSRPPPPGTSRPPPPRTSRPPPPRTSRPPPPRISRPPPEPRL
jgi:hypothetical protein